MDVWNGPRKRVTEYCSVAVVANYQQLKNCRCLLCMQEENTRLHPFYEGSKSAESVNSRFDNIPSVANYAMQFLINVLMAGQASSTCWLSPSNPCLDRFMNAGIVDEASRCVDLVYGRSDAGFLEFRLASFDNVLSATQLLSLLRPKARKQLSWARAVAGWISYRVVRLEKFNQTGYFATRPAHSLPSTNTSLLVATLPIARIRLYGADQR